MAAITAQLAPDNTTDASFRAWGKPLSDFFDSVGLIKTADTGQINWATTLKPPSFSTAGYEIRQFTDALQSSNPVFFKIAYGGPNGVHPGFQITVGTGTNGAGTLNGKVSVVAVVDGNVTNATPQTCVFSGSSNRVAISMFAHLNTAATFFSIERTKNIAGDDTGEGILLFKSGLAGKSNYFIPFVDLVPPLMLPGIFTPTGITTAIQNSDVNLYPNYFYNNFGKVFPPGINHLAYFNADVTAQTIKQLSMYGVNRNYYFLGGLQYLDNVARGAVVGTCLAMLYE